MRSGRMLSRREAVKGAGVTMALPLLGSPPLAASRSVEGKVVLVTGSGRNLGRATVIEMARRGADVVVNARSNMPEAEAVAAEAEAFGVRALALLADVGNEEQVNRMVGAVLAEFGRIDVLINNAAIRPAGSFLDMTTRAWREVLAVNLDGAYFCSKAVVPSMISNGGGRIINVSGLNSWTGGHTAHVCASKMGALGLTRALANELGVHNILVNIVVPGAWDLSGTPMSDLDGAISPRAEDIPQRRVGLPQELANVFAFLASDDASFITGQTLHVNGGELRY